MLVNLSFFSFLMLSCFENLSGNLSRYIVRNRFFLQTASIHRLRHSQKADDDFCNDTEKREDRIHLCKSRGQHLLTNQRILDTIVRKSNVRPSDTILEIGPGTGNLTMKLLDACERVVAIEIDPRMVEILQKRGSEAGFLDKLTVIRSDALKMEFPPFDLVVANIPYGISSPLVAKLVFGQIKYRSVTLLLQKEFARRLLANPGDSEFNRLAANVSLVANVEFVMDVSKRDFVPVPKVDSSVVKIYPKDEVPSVDLNEWWAFTRTCFSKKNKTLGATFKQKKKLVELMRLSEMKELGSKSDTHCLHNHTCDLEESLWDDTSDGEDVPHNHTNDGEDGVCNEEGIDLSIDSKKKMSLFREKVVDVLRLGGFEGKRPAKLTTEEMLNLLSMFNQAGIYFHSQAKAEDTSDQEFAAL